MGTDPTCIQVVLDLGLPFIFPLTINLIPKMDFLFFPSKSFEASIRFFKNKFQKDQKSAMLRFRQYSKNLT